MERASRRRREWRRGWRGDHAGVFGDEEHGELETGVLGVKAGDEFGFGFWEVEGDAIGFRYGGYEEAEEAEDLREGTAKNVPAENAAESEKAVAIGLIIDDVAQAEAAGHQQDADYGHGEGEFIADHLRG